MPVDLTCVKSALKKLAILRAIDAARTEIKDIYKFLLIFFLNLELNNIIPKKIWKKNA